MISYLFNNQTLILEVVGCVVKFRTSLFCWVVVINFSIKMVYKAKLVIGLKNLSYYINTTPLSTWSEYKCT